MMAASFDPVSIPVPSTPILFLLAGIATHSILATFEPYPQHLVLPALCSLVALFYQRFLALDSILHALLSTTFISTAYVSVLLTSIAVYRLVFHRLRHFPGPRLLALSKWSMLSDDMHGFRYRTIDRLHSLHGPILRTGPRELSINDASTIPAIYGAQSTCVKGPWYRGIAGDRPLHQQSLYETRDKQTHAQQRKLWNSALSHNARIAHVGVIDALVNKTIAQIRQRKEDDSVDIVEWCDILSFDVMCEIGFSRRLNLIEDGKRSRELVTLQKAVAHAQVIGHLPYLSKILQWLPKNRIHLFKVWVTDRIAERVEAIQGKTDWNDFKVDDVPHSMPPSPPLTPTSDEDAEPSSDVMSRLLHHNDNMTPHRRNQMIAEGMLLAVGGSDTTSAALTMALYLLTKHPRVADDVRAELSRVLGPRTTHYDSVLLADTLKDACPLLNAVIEETLRLFPPDLSGLQRQTPPEGLMLSIHDTQTYIPGNTVLSVPPWSIQRDALNFSPAPHAFRPERWLHPEREERMEGTGAFMAFGHGPTGCAGREVAWIEMRMFLARFLGAFDMAFEEGFEEEVFEEGVRDLFTMHITVPLRLRLTERGGEGKL